MFVLTVSQAAHLLPHEMYIFGIFTDGNYLIKCKECDREILYNPKGDFKARILIEGEMVEIKGSDGLIFTNNYPHSINLESLQEKAPKILCVDK